MRDRSCLETLMALCAAAALVTAQAEPAAPPTATQAAPAAAAKPGKSTKLNKIDIGKVNVNAMRQTVETLREMKGALQAPFSNDPKHYDDMVCRFDDNEGFRAQGVLLECGTQGWFSMRRGAHTVGDMSGADASPVTLGHPWHTMRLLNHEQAQSLRELLKLLPPPGQGDVQLLDHGLHAGTRAAPAASTAPPPR